MKHTSRVVLQGRPEQLQQLHALQVAFSELCNAIAPVVQATRCWNRVALHHLVYRNMRERFPALGSQMICNAVYSVSRTARAIYQNPASPWHLGKLGDAPLPLLHFTASAPVYFDRHTLSLKGRALSMYTLDGRARFSLTLAPSVVARFERDKLLEAVMVATPAGFELVFQFEEAESGTEAEQAPATGPLPDYVNVIPHASAPPIASAESPRIHDTPPTRPQA